MLILSRRIKLPSPVMAHVGWMCHDFDGFWSMCFVVASEDDDDEAMLLSGNTPPSMLASVPDDTESEIGVRSSCRPNNFSNSFGSFAIGKSCLLAKIKSGVPWKQNFFVRKSDEGLIETDYLIVWTLCRSHKLHLCFFHSFQIYWVNHKDDSIGAPCVTSPKWSQLFLSANV